MYFICHIVFTIPTYLSDKEIKYQLQKLDEKLESMNGSLVVINERLESQNMTDGQCVNTKTGSFDSPGHNCSHIKYDHPLSKSGTSETRTKYTSHYYKQQCYVHYNAHIVLIPFQVTTGFRDLLAMQ